MKIHVGDSVRKKWNRYKKVGLGSIENMLTRRPFQAKKLKCCIGGMNYELFSTYSGTL
jgi:hypothetical protein